MIAVSWALSFTISSPCLYFYDVSDFGVYKELCRTYLGESWDSLFFIIFIVMVTYLIPVIGITAVYVQIFKYIWRVGPPWRPLHRTMNSVPRAKVKMVKLIMVVNVFVILLMAPIFMGQLYHGLRYDLHINPTHYITLLWIYFSTTVIKPVLYLVFNSNFRRGCKEVFCFSSSTCHRHNVYTITTLPGKGRNNHIGIAEMEGEETENNVRKTPSHTFDRATVADKHAWPLNSTVSSSYL